METLDSKQRISRKEHRCNFCGGVIKIGEKYDWQKNIYDGILYEWKAHLSCCGIASKLRMYDYADDGVTEECFIETINEEYDSICDHNEKVFPPFADRLTTVKHKHGIL